MGHPPRHGSRAGLAGALSAVLLPWLLWSCAKYYYHGESYGSQEDALAAQQKLHEDALSKITPLPAPVADYLLVGIPSREVLDERAVLGDGRPSARVWVVTILLLDFLNTGRAIEKRGIFKKVKLQKTRGNHLDAPSGGMALYLFIPDKTASGWYFKRANSAPVPVFFEHGNPDLAARYTYICWG